MTSDNDGHGSGKNWLQSSSQVHLHELGRRYKLGNKIALHDAISLSKQYSVPLPDWAASALQDLVIERWAGQRNTWSGYRALISKYIRSEVYRAASLWVENKRHYKRMPTRCIQAWYDGEFDDLPKIKEQAVMAVTFKGLLGTVAVTGSHSVVEKQRYFEAISEADKLQHEDFEIAEYLDMTPDEYRAYIASGYRDQMKSPLSFGYDEAEVIFGLRYKGQFWGPPYDPPQHIQQILDAEPMPHSLAST